MEKPLRAAVIGGSGFGKYHAQWYAREGVQVVAYTCTSPESVESAGGPIRDLTGHEPRGYDDLQTMLREEQPNLVSVCTPPSEHDQPTLSALEAGAHVLCEKPLLYDPSLSAAELLSRSEAMVRQARESNRHLGVNLQYAAALEPYRELYEGEWADLSQYNSYRFEMESKGNRHGAHHFEEIWVELGPHALTPLLMSLPNASPVEGSLKTEMSETDVRVEVEFEDPGGHRIPVSIRTGACPKEATPVRRFGFNGFLVDLSARKDDTGTFLSVLRSVESGKELEADDFMRVSIRRFVQAVRGDGTPLVTGDEAQRNSEVMLSVLSRLQR